MGLSSADRGQKIVIFSNALLRFIQLIIGAATVGAYAQQKGFWFDHGIPSRIDYEFAVGSLAIITSIVLGIVPFVLSYRPVSFAAPWDLIMFLLYSAAFGLMKAIFYHDYNPKDKFKVDTNSQSTMNNHWRTMMDDCWINLAGMILFLISSIMGCTLFLVGRRVSGGSKASYV